MYWQMVLRPQHKVFNTKGLKFNCLFSQMFKWFLSSDDKKVNKNFTNNGFQQERALYLSLKYEFVTPLTSLVVVKPGSKEKGDFDDADEMAEKKITFRYQRKNTQGSHYRYSTNNETPLVWLTLVTKFICTYKDHWRTQIILSADLYKITH